MRRIQYRHYGGPEELRLEACGQSVPGQDEIRVCVKAASANPMDWKIRSGMMKMMTGSHFPRGVGTDFAGIVEAVGPAVTRFKVGDAVFGAMGMKDTGSFAETIVTPEKTAALKPDALSFEQAATLPIAGGTAWAALVTKAQLKAGQTIFINGCLGGVGSAAVQIARMIGADISGSCSADRFDEARALGVTTVVDYRHFEPEQFRERFDVVFDTAGALSTGQCSTMVKNRGVALHINLNGRKMFKILLSRRNRIVFGDTTPGVLTKLGEAAVQGQLTLAIGETVSLDEAIAAITNLEKTGLPKGKLVIVPVE
jgi:NADPH:quinone reductase-like Zn-dependent oxidoreductase